MDIKMIIFALIKICSIIQLTNAQGNYFWPLQWLKKSQHKFFQKTQSSSFYFFSSINKHSYLLMYSDTESFKHKILCLVCLFILKCSDNIEYTLFNSSSNKQIFKAKSTSPYRAWLRLLLFLLQLNAL